MNIPKDNSSIRYFLASLKPLGRFMFWGPLGFLALALIFYWQIQQNPQLISPIKEAVPTNPFAETLPGEKSPSAPQPVQAPNASPAKDQQNWASDYTDRLSQEQLQPFSIDQPELRKKAQINNPVPQNGQKQSSLFMPLLPSVQSNSKPNYTPIKPLQIQSGPRGDNQLQRAMDQAGLNTPSSVPGYPRPNNNPYGANPGTVPNNNNYAPYSAGVNTGNQPYNNYAPNGTVNPPQGYQPNYPSVNPPQGYQPNYPGNSPAPGTVNNPYNSGYSQPPAPRSPQIKPYIQTPPAGY
jgi:hypothetical protein